MMNEAKNMINKEDAVKVENVNKIEKIRVNSGIKIEVNDAGDTITIPVEDMQFMDRLYGMIDNVKKSANRLSSVKNENTRDQLNKIIEECNNITQEIDALFGAGCCKKIFGDVTPTPYVIIDFFNQLGPIIGRYANERQSRIMKKYNVNGHRQGTKKKNYYHKRK